MNKFNINQVVYADDFMPRLVIGIYKTCLGVVYDTLTIANEVEVCFEHQLTNKSLYEQLRARNI